MRHPEQTLVHQACRHVRACTWIRFYSSICKWNISVLDKVVRVLPNVFLVKGRVAHLAVVVLPKLTISKAKWIDWYFWYYCRCISYATFMKHKIQLTLSGAWGWWKSFLHLWCVSLDQLFIEAIWYWVKYSNPILLVCYGCTIQSNGNIHNILCIIFYTFTENSAWHICIFVNSGIATRIKN